MHTTTDDDDPFGWPDADPLDRLLVEDEDRPLTRAQRRAALLDAWHDVMTEREAAASEPVDWRSW